MRYNLPGPPPIHSLVVGGEQEGFKRSHLMPGNSVSADLQTESHKMVEWTDFERDTIQDIFSRIEYDVVGPAALARCLVVYPWTQRYFGGFGNLYNAAAIKGNPMVSKHGTTILHGLDRAVKNMDDIKNTYAELSVLHSEKLHVDPDNFKLLADCLTIVVAAQLGNEFSGEVQAAFQKFLAVVVSSLGRQYH
ncbi:Hemoglobin subunit beta-2 [Dissostichus eleginoides]|nr:Hemoglobin subunit beta-2 [Dissostichus eleginoides]KAI9539421.1 Hemoglobin subunit beta-2 [Dissostichus eleginoides]